MEVNMGSNNNLKQRLSKRIHFKTGYESPLKTYVLHTKQPNFVTHKIYEDITMLIVYSTDNMKH